MAARIAKRVRGVASEAPARGRASRHDQRSAGEPPILRPGAGTPWCPDDHRLPRPWRLVVKPKPHVVGVQRLADEAREAAPMERDAAVVLGNAGTADEVDVLMRALDGAEPLVGEHAARRGSSRAPGQANGSVSVNTGPTPGVLSGR